jgi:hypothetical protein
MFSGVHAPIGLSRTVCGFPLARPQIGGDGVRLTFVQVHSLVATKIATNPSKLDIVKSMTFEIVRLRFHKVTLF